MKIIAIPRRFSPAFGGETFKIGASEDELVEVDIYDKTFAKIIGKKRFAGATEYDLNVANYAKGQLVVEPFRVAESTVKVADGRLAAVRIVAAGQSAETVFTGGIEAVGQLVKMSRAPQSLEITPSQSFELSLPVEMATISVALKFSGTQGDVTITIPAVYVENKIVSICVNMADVAAKLETVHGKKIALYETMHLVVTNNAGRPKNTITFMIARDTPKNVRLYWWNRYGQIDQFTMRLQSETLEVDKNLIYTSQGYKSISSEAQRQMALVSDYKDAQTMRWLSEMVASPAVWVDSGVEFVPVEIMTDRVVVESSKLARMELSMVYKKRDTYQNL